MRYICTRDEMQAIDAASIHQLGIPGIVLMEKAAMAMEEEILARFSPSSSVLVLAECGNNGGDGLALARLLHARGFTVTVCEIGGVKKASDSYRIQKEILENLDIPLYDKLPEADYDILIDAVFGVGLTRAVSGIWADLISELNSRKGFKIAVDVPSGVDASNGRVLSCAFKADLTVTFGLMKVGLLLWPGASYAGEVIVKEIGFPARAVEMISPRAVSYDMTDLERLPCRDPWSNKGSYGRVLLVAGSRNMAGAAFLSALSAYRSGAGLVRIFTCEDNREILQTLMPEAIMTTFRDEEEGRRLLSEALEWATVIGIGPGLGVNRMSRICLETVLSKGTVPVVIDADGLNVLAESMGSGNELESSFRNYPAGIILTPHLKEMERLTGKPVSCIRENLIALAEEAADPGHIYVLKDARTIVSDGAGPAYINQSGNHGMSQGGSGDVLTGIICGFLAGGLPLLEAARLGVYCHGLAGDAAAAEKGYYGMGARDIARCLSQVIH